VFKKAPRNDGPVDIGPCRDIYRRDVVCRASVAAADTPEAVPIGAVGPLVGSADGTDVARPHGVHHNDWDSSEASLVLHKAAELIESPRIVAATLRPANRGPASDALQVLKGYPPLRAFGLRQQPPGDDVVGVPSEAGLPARQLSEMPFRAPGAAPLEVGLQILGLLAYPVNLPSAVALTVAVHREVLQPEVHAKRPYWVEWRRLWGLYGGGKVEYAVAEEEVGLSSELVHTCLLVLPYAYGNIDSVLNGEDGGILQTFPAEYPFIVDHGAVRPERTELAFIPLVDFYDLADGPDNHLSREPISFPDSVVDEFVEGPLVGEPVLEGYFGDVVAGLVESLHSSQKEVVLFLIRCKLHQERQLHCVIEELIP